MFDITGAVLLAVLLVELALPIYFTFARRPIMARCMAMAMLYCGLAGFVGGCAGWLWRHAYVPTPPHDMADGLAVAVTFIGAPFFGVMVATPCLMAGGIIGAIWGHFRERRPKAGPVQQPSAPE